MSRIIKSIQKIGAVENGDIVIGRGGLDNSVDARSSTVEQVPANGGAVVAPPVVRSLFEIPPLPANDEAELLRYRYLCRGGALLLCGLTGIGKSSWCMQAIILWALGLPFCGITPARPLKSLLVQAENDDGDIIEMRDSVCAGLNLNPEQIALVKEMVWVVREDQRTSFAFLQGVLRPTLEQHKPDLLWIDPVLAYLGADASKQADVSTFLRNGLNPILREFNCGCVVVAHGSKPPTGKEKSGWQAGDYAYAATGSVEWGNWARAVLVIRSIGSYTEFELVAAKRGGRLRWTDDMNEPIQTKYIRQDGRPGVIFWHQYIPEDQSRLGRPRQYVPEDLLQLLPADGLTATEWLKEAKKEHGIAERQFYNLKKRLVDNEQVVQVKLSKKWQSNDQPLQ